MMIPVVIFFFLGLATPSQGNEILKALAILKEDMAADIQTIRTDINMMQAGLAYQIRTVKKDIGNLQADSRSVKAATATLQSDIKGIKNDLSGLQSKVTSELNGLKTDVNGLKIGFNSIKNDMTNLKSKIDVQTSEMNGVKIKLGNVQTVLDNVQKDSKKTTEELKQEITEGTKNTALILSKTKKDSSAISTVQSGINKLLTNTNMMGSNLQSTKSDVSEIKSGSQLVFFSSTSKDQEALRGLRFVGFGLRKTRVDEIGKAASSLKECLSYCATVRKERGVDWDDLYYNIAGTHCWCQKGGRGHENNMNCVHYHFL